jgi:hypothetical protein
MQFKSLKSMNRLFVLMSSICMFVVCANCQDPPVGHYAFNDKDIDAYSSDSSFVNLGGILTVDRFGRPNEALYFDGKGERAIIKDPSYFPIVGDFTFSFWLKSKSKSRIEAFSNTSNANYNFAIDLSPSTGTWVYWNGGGETGVNDPKLVLADNQWHHMLVTRKNGHVGLYVDGTLRISFYYPMPMGAVADLYVGGSSTFPFEGTLDDYKFYTRSLSNTEIRDLYAERPFFVYPTATSTLQGGQSEDIIVNGAGTAFAYVNLEVSYNLGKTWSALATNLPAQDELYKWKAPDANRDCKLRLRDNASGEILGVSETFKVRRPTVNTRYTWEKVIENAPFVPRDGAGAVVLNGSAWFMGGWNPDEFPTITTNEVWQSNDGGTWEFRGNAPWEGRHVSGWVTFKNAIWIVGGDLNQERFQTDVWNSTDGITWNKIAETLPWTERGSHMVAVFKNKLWMVGGQQINNGALAGDTVFNDVWNSSDGIHWKMVTPNAPWAGRGFGKLIDFNNRLWLVGGGRYNDPKIYYNEVWSTADGVNWTKHATPPWRPRYFQEAVVFDSKIWILGGLGDNGANLGDVWYSSDGNNWVEMENIPWLPRHAATAFVFDKSIYLSCGTAGNYPQELANDIWKLSPSLSVEFPTDGVVVKAFGESHTLQTIGSIRYDYQWLRDGAILAGETNRALEIKEDGNYALSVVNPLNGYSGTSKNIKVLFGPKAELNIAGDTAINDKKIALKAFYDPAYKYTWYFNNKSIPNLDTSVFVAKHEGQYFVKVTGTNGIEVSSLPVQVAFQGVWQNTEVAELILLNRDDRDLDVYYVNRDMVGKLCLRLVDINGQELYREISEKVDITHYFTVNIERFSPGMFIAVLEAYNDKKVKKFVKQ